MKPTEVEKMIEQVCKEFGLHYTITNGIMKDGSRTVVLDDPTENVDKWLPEPIVDRLRELVGDGVEMLPTSKMTEKARRLYGERQRRCEVRIKLPPYFAPLCSQKDMEVILKALQDGSWIRGMSGELNYAGDERKPNSKLYKVGERVRNLPHWQQSKKTKFSYYYVSSYRAPGGGMFRLLRSDGRFVSCANISKWEGE